MKIIEQTIAGKRSMAECEDGLVADGRFVAVIDGSTSKTPVRVSSSMSNGRYCMKLVAEYLSEAPEDIDVCGFCRGVTAFVRSVYVNAGVDMSRLEDNPAERLTASAVIYSSVRNEVWIIGDCQCIVGGVLYDNPKPCEHVLAERRAAYLAGALAGGLRVEDVQASDPGRQYIMEGLVASCLGQNKDYSVIDGFDIPLDKVKVVKVADDAQDIVLASDGYPFLKPTLAESEAALAAQLADDPLCIFSYKATKGLMAGNKSFDDRCYIRFSR